MGPAEEAGCPRAVPPCSKPHDYERSPHARCRVSLLRLVASGGLDACLFPRQRDLLLVGGGACTRTAVRRQLSTLQGERTALDTELARLAALVPRPRSHLIRYHAVLAPKCPPPPPRRAAATHAAPTRRPRFLPVSATADNARTANHHPAPTPRIPTVEILKLTGHPGFWIYYPLTPHKTLRIGDQNISRCRSDEPRA